MAQSEQPVRNHSACEGRLSGLPWQQLRASLSVWPPTAEAPDWLHSPSSLPCSLTPTHYQQLPASFRQIMQSKCRAGVLRLSVCTLPCVGGATPRGFRQHWPGLGTVQDQAAGKTKADFRGFNKSLGSPQTLILMPPPPLSPLSSSLVYSHRSSEDAWVQILAPPLGGSVTSGNLLNSKMGIIATPVSKGCGAQ